MFGKTGLCLAFGNLYVLHTDIFPTFFLASSYGICNFVCRSLGLLGPLVAEVENKRIPLLLLTILSFVGAVFTGLMKKKTG
jgi:hypothetical protein